MDSDSFCPPPRLTGKRIEEGEEEGKKNSSVATQKTPRIKWTLFLSFFFLFSFTSLFLFKIRTWLDLYFSSKKKGGMNE